MTPRIIRPAAVAHEPMLLAPPDRDLDDATRQLVARERAAAHAAGLEEGAARAREEARRDSAAIVAAIGAAAGELVALVRAQHEGLAAALGERVLDATAAVLGREPDDDGRALVERLVAVVADLDDPDIVVRVPAERTDAVRAALDDDRARVVDDEALGIGEARVTGAFADVDLRTTAMLAALDEVLAGVSPLGALPPATEQGEDR